MKRSASAKPLLIRFFLESHFELISYYTIVATAGQDAAPNALVTNPEHLKKRQETYAMMRLS